MKHIAPETAIIHPRSYVGMFDYGDVIAYILLVLRKIKPNDDTKEDINLEIKDIIKRASEGKEIPVKLASGKRERNRIGE